MAFVQRLSALMFTPLLKRKWEKKKTEYGANFFCDKFIAILETLADNARRLSDEEHDDVGERRFTKSQLLRNDLKWDYGWYTRLQFLAENDEPAAFAYIVSRADSAILDSILEIGMEWCPKFIEGPFCDGNMHDLFCETNSSDEDYEIFDRVNAACAAAFIKNPSVRRNYERKFGKNILE